MRKKRGNEPIQILIIMMDLQIFSFSSSFERWLVDKGGADDDEIVKRFIYHRIKE